MDDVFNYECDDQITIDDYLWDTGYYMPLPIEKEEENTGNITEIM